MKTSRRNFLQMLGAAAVSLLAPKREKDKIVIQDSEAVVKPDDFHDYFDSVVNAVEQCASDGMEWSVEGDPEKRKRIKSVLDSCECGPINLELRFSQCQDIEPGAEVYITRDWGETWALAGEITNTRDTNKITSVSCPPTETDPYWTIQHYITEKLGRARWVSARIKDVVWIGDDT